MSLKRWLGTSVKHASASLPQVVGKLSTLSDIGCAVNGHQYPLVHYNSSAMLLRSCPRPRSASDLLCAFHIKPGKSRELTGTTLTLTDADTEADTSLLHNGFHFAGMGAKASLHPT